jgi:hypothetical protein
MNLTGADGTSEANAWPDIQYAIDSLEASGWSVDGNWLHVKSGTDEVLAGIALTATEWGVNNPLRIQGYQTNAKDGLAQAVVDCQGLQMWNGSTGDAKELIDLEIKNGPAANWIMQIGRYCKILRCYIHDSGGGLHIDSTGNTIQFCRIEDVGTASLDGIWVNNGWNQIIGNWILESGSRTMQYGIRNTGTNNHYLYNIVTMDGTGTAMSNSQAYVNIVGNTFFQNSAGSGTGIHLTAIAASGSSLVGNNYVEGFSVAYQFDGSSGATFVFAGNAVHNNTTVHAGANESYIDLGSNETLTNSGIAKSGSNTYANRFTYFKPVDEGNMLTGGLPEAL